jgi:hypothetical protein
MRSVVDACMTDIKDVRKKTDYQDAIQADLEKMELNPEEKEAVLERQEIPKRRGRNSLPEGMQKRDDDLPRND